MDARVSATSTVHAQLGARDRCERTLEVILNGITAGLTLPSRKRRAVVRDDELQPLRHLVARGDLRIRRAEGLPGIKITLKDHLGRDLIYDAARLAGLDAAVSQRTVGRGRA